MKLTKNSFNVMATVGGIVGGVSAKFVEGFIEEHTESDNAYLPAIVEAVVGSALSAFVKNDVVLLKMPDYRAKTRHGDQS